MNSCALELDCLLLSYGHLVHLGDCEAKVALARELGFVNWAIVNLIDAVRNRLLHDDMGVGNGEESGRSHDGRSDGHNADSRDGKNVQRQFRWKFVENVSDLVLLVV